MNENAERINGLAAMLGIVAALGAYAVSGQIIPGVWWMTAPELILVVYILMVIAFIFKANDDQDPPDKGILQPVTIKK